MCCSCCSRCPVVVVGVYPPWNSHLPYDAKSLLETREDELVIVKETACDLVAEIDKWIQEENIRPIHSANRHIVALLILRQDESIDTVSWDANQMFLYYNSVAYKGNCDLFQRVVSRLPYSFTEYFTIQEILPCSNWEGLIR